jgi:endoglucanase
MEEINNFTRRSFLKTSGAFGASLVLPSTLSSVSNRKLNNRLPYWRGFNLQYFYKLNRGIHEPKEEHFKWISDWGFNFVRLPMAYRTWLKKKVYANTKISIDEIYRIDEYTLSLIDKAVYFGDKYDIHVNLCFHHAPGYCIHSGVSEPFSLWGDKEAVEAFKFHWELFAKRYKHVDASKLSFNLFNEAPWPYDNFNGALYKWAISPAVKAIRGQNPDRIIIADGAGAGNLVVPELIPLGLDQSVHCYIPGSISHYDVSWISGVEWPKPNWPGAIDLHGYKWDRERLELYYSPWKRLIEQGIGVHMGETSGSHKLPHDVFLRWFGDVLDIFRGMEVGYCLWDFIGASNFGLLDSNRNDIQYEDWYGHKLDRKLLTMLQRY